MRRWYAAFPDRSKDDGVGFGGATVEEAFQQPRLRFDRALRERIVWSLTRLRALVGSRPPDHFLRGEPGDHDAECRAIPFYRAWHSRMGDLPSRCEEYRPMCKRPLKGTLGGWRLGIVRGPFAQKAKVWLKNLVNKDNQQRRFVTRAGLPTLRQFYDYVDLSGQRDPVTGWLLSEIGRYLDETRLIRRSDIPLYTCGLRHGLMELHDRIMRVSVPEEISDNDLKRLESEIRQIVDEWVRRMERLTASST